MNNLTNQDLNLILDGLYATRDNLSTPSDLTENMRTIKKVYAILIAQPANFDESLLNLNPDFS